MDSCCLPDLGTTSYDYVGQIIKFAGQVVHDELIHLDLIFLHTPNQTSVLLINYGEGIFSPYLNKMLNLIIILQTMVCQTRRIASHFSYSCHKLSFSSLIQMAVIIGKGCC